MSNVFASFGGITNVPKVPQFVIGETDVDLYLKDIERTLKKVGGVINELGIAVEASHAVDQSRILNLTADNIFANNIITEDLTVGSDGNIILSGLQDTIDIFDNQAIPELRVRIGKLGATATEWGIQVMDSAGVVKFQSSTATFIDGAIITNATIASAKIINVDGSIIDTNSITSAKIVSLDGAKLQALTVDSSAIAGLAITESKIGTGAVTNSKIGAFAITDSEIATGAVTNSKIGSLAVTNAKIGTLAVTDSEIDNLTISTGKHQANAITDSTVDAGTNLSWATTDSAEKTTCSASVATGGVDVVVLWSGEFTKSSVSTPTVKVRYKRAGVTQKELDYYIDQNQSYGMTLVYTDTGTTGTHTLTITIDPSASPVSPGTYNLNNSQCTFILLKT